MKTPHTQTEKKSEYNLDITGFRGFVEGYIVFFTTMTSWVAYTWPIKVFGGVFIFIHKTSYG